MSIALIPTKKGHEFCDAEQAMVFHPRVKFNNCIKTHGRG